MADKQPLKKGSFTTKNKLEFIRGGEAYFSLLTAIIGKARKTVHLQAYIFNNDATGSMVTDALVAAAERGVRVYFLIDGYASQTPSSEILKRFAEAGVYYDEFEPLFRGSNFYFGRRMHHKVAVIDGYTSLVGGRNLADRYNDIDGIPAWLDYAVMIEGEASFELDMLCCNMWNKNSSKCIAAKENYDHARAEAIPADERCSVRVRRNDWVKRKNQVWKSYFDLFNNAHEEVVIMCSYFLPGILFRKMIEKAVKRGVRMRIVTAGKSDVMIAKYAERYWYRWMLRNKIELYEYRENVLHAKVAVQDIKWMTIGSYNVNNISAYASIELNVDIRNRPFVGKVYDELETVINEQCDRITDEAYKKTGIFMQLIHRLSYEFVRITLYLFTFYFKKEE